MFVKILVDQRAEIITLANTIQWLRNLAASLKKKYNKKPLYLSVLQ